MYIRSYNQCSFLQLTESNVELLLTVGDTETVCTVVDTRSNRIDVQDYE